MAATRMACATAPTDTAAVAANKFHAAQLLAAAAAAAATTTAATTAALVPAAPVIIATPTIRAGMRHAIASADALRVMGNHWPHDVAARIQTWQ